MDQDKDLQTPTAEAAVPVEETGAATETATEETPLDDAKAEEEGGDDGE